MKSKDSVREFLTSSRKNKKKNKEKFTLLIYSDEKQKLRAKTFNQFEKK